MELLLYNFMAPIFFTTRGKSSFTSCSQNRRTSNPWFLSIVFTSLSRIRLRSSLLSQYSGLDFGRRLQAGQACQKHPSTKMIRRFSIKAKSGLPSIPSTCIRQPEIPAWTKPARNRHSVERLPLERTRDIIRERVFLSTVSIYFGIVRLRMP